MTSTQVFVGVDISKAQLDLALRPEGQFSVPNHEAGFAQVLEHRNAVHPTLVVLEATGGWEIPLTGVLAAAGVPVVVVNPRQVRDFAKATGRLAKTDALDAQMLAHFAEVMRPEPRPLPDEQTQALAALLARRRQLVEMLTAEKNRLGTAGKPVRKSLRTHIAWLERELSHTDRGLAQTIQESPVWREKEAQPAELGWGTHERHFPKDGRRHDFGCGAAIYLLRPGAATRVRSWTPLEGPYHGFLITHGELISIADYLTLRDGDRVRSRPTCHYAYHPCDDAVLSLHEFAGKNWRLQRLKRLMMEEITDGIDELGVLLMGPPGGVYWYGSRLTIAEARRAAPHNNATSLQVTAAVLAGVVWALEHPRQGIVEPEEMDFERVLDIARPYLGEVVGVRGDWTPLDGREHLFAEDLDREDPWQFKNIRVV